MRIVSYNVNGIRAAIKKGWIEWLKEYPIDVLCVQETKASENDVDLQIFKSLGYHISWLAAQKKGYSGVAIFSKVKPDFVQLGSGYKQSDEEGRVIRMDIGELTIVNAYFPSGTSGELRQNYKYQWLKEFETYLKKLKKTRTKIIVAGDFNIAHQEIDIHDPKGNKKSSGFLPEERAWMTKFLNSGWIDTFREFHKEAHRYSWWSQRFPSVRLNNKGWRIDYFAVTESMKKQLVDADIFPDVKHSDHCPIYLEIKK